MTPNDPDCDHFLGPDNSWDGISTRRIGNLHPSPLSLAVLVSVFNLGLKGTQLSIVSLVCEIKTPLLTIICFICYSKKQPNSKIDVLSKVMAFWIFRDRQPTARFDRSVLIDTRSDILSWSTFDNRIHIVCWTVRLVLFQCGPIPDFWLETNWS